MINIIEKKDARYPAKLRPLKGMPSRLYYIGDLPEAGPSVAIVGARACSAYGRSMALALGKYLAEHGVPVISGMAAGIDGYAHEGALSGGGSTWAVLGCGPDVCYPRTNRRLYETIGRAGGILSEYAPGTPPLPAQFPARNRIISALADIVVVVEARKKSGSLITADFALEQGKTVMAFPGRCGDLLSEGTNYLIAQGAGIVWELDAVLEELQALPQETGGAERKPRQTLGDPAERKERKLEETEYPPGISEEARAALSALSAECLGISGLRERTGYPDAVLKNVLLELLFAGAVREISPGLYVRSR